MVKRLVPPDGDQETVVEALEGLSQKALLAGDAWTSRLLISTAELLAAAMKPDRKAANASMATAVRDAASEPEEADSLFGFRH